MRRAIIASSLFAFLLSGCRTEKAAVADAQKVLTAEQQEKAKVSGAAAEHDKQRAQMARIPLPTKSMYVDVHEPSAWKNPFVAVSQDTLDLRVIYADATPALGDDSMLRPEGARRKELQIRPAELSEALLALPDSAWHYGRVVAVAESPAATRQDRAAVRRNVESVIRTMNDIGIVVDEWQTR